MLSSKLVGFDRVHGVEAVVTVWVVQNEGVGVDIGDEVDQGPGAALIKKYSSYRTKQKKFHVFFPQNRSLGT